MADRRFRFGYIAGPAADMGDWVSAARRAETMGFATFLTPDTLHTPAPLPALAAAAGAARQIRLGTWVLADPMRNAGMLAWEAATVDALSGGRLELGLGAGRADNEGECRRLGLQFPPAGERVTRLADTITTLKSALADEAGPLGPAPAQHPRPPILIAGAGPRMLRLAGREADIAVPAWMPGTPQDTARRAVDTIRAAAGERFDNIEIGTALLAVDGHMPEFAARWADPAALSRPDTVGGLAGTPRQKADRLRELREVLGLSYIVVSADNAERLAPVIEELAGR